MWCGVCQKNLSECTCEDLEERLQKVSNSLATKGSGGFAYKRCRKCEKHYTKCRCEQPEFYIYHGQGTN